MDYCSSCGICTQVCSHDVKIAEINSMTRAQMWEDQGIPLRNQLIARPSVLGRMGTPVAPMANGALRETLARALAHRLLGIHHKAPMPRFAGRTFQRWARSHRSPTTDRTVVYFHGYGTNMTSRESARSCSPSCEHNGYHVIALAAGAMRACAAVERQLRRRAALQPAACRRYGHAREGLAIGANATSCSLMLKREAEEILGIEDDDLKTVSAATYDLCEFLLLLHERGELRTDFRPLPLTVPYHAPCQQQGHGIGKPALDLLALIPGLRVIELDADCCGIAGTYGLKKEKYGISMAVGERLFSDVKAAGADLAACDSETCRWQIAHGTGLDIVHPVELLYRAYGLDRPGIG